MKLTDAIRNDNDHLKKPPAIEATQPEFGRHQDVRRLFGIKRGILYRLINDGKIRSITLREPGRRFGCRLIYLPSVRAYLNSLLAEQSPVQAKPNSQQQLAHAEGLKEAETST